MDRKIRLLAVASMVAVMASGCSSYRGSSQAGVNTGTSSSGGYGIGQAARSGQVAASGTTQVARRGFGQSQRSRSATVNDSCAACAAAKAQNTYTYKPAKPAAPAPAPRPAAPVVQAPANSKSQQYYIDRWNRQQAQQQRQAAAPKQQNTNYAGYGQTGQSNTTYYDYSSAARTTAPATSNATSNKSIYTGSYQQKTYTPTTYSGGSAATTNTGTTSVASASSGGGSSYVVKKGDTVFEIMRQTGVYWKDIISMNSLQPPYNINPGQTLRLK